MIWQIKERDDVERLLYALGLDLVVDLDTYLPMIGRGGIRVSADEAEGTLRFVIAGYIWSLPIGTKQD